MDTTVITPGEPALYVVATPIGNLSDLSSRACNVLCDVRLIAAEDTRHTSQLIAQIGSSASLISAHAHNERSRVDQLVQVLAGGESCALVSDAGTPAISDPGARLVAGVRAAGYRVIPVPGPNSVVTLLSAAGLDADRFGAAADRFHFEGFLSPKAAARRTRLSALTNLEAVLVLMEAPHRIVGCLADIKSTFEPGRTLVIGRELTKRFEQIVSIECSQGPDWLASDANHQRGEFVLAIAPKPVPQGIEQQPVAEITANSEVTIEVRAGRLMQALLTEMPPARAAKVARGLTGLPQKALYAIAVELQSSR